jgi:uncharacterized protein YukE
MYPGQSGQLRPTQPAWPSAPPSTPQPSSSGPDGHQLTQPVNGHLDYVSQLSRQLGVTDPVESYLTPVVGRWSDLHAEATRWRTAASTATAVTQTLTKPLGGLDAAWQGPAADSFVDYMQNVGLAGNDLADAMHAMADALDKTADGLRQIVNEMLGVLSDTAEQASHAMSVPVGGEDRARQFLSEVNQPTSQLYESVRDVLSAFVRMCDGARGSSMKLAHPVPARNWTDPTAQSTPRGSQPVWPGQPTSPAQPTPAQPTPTPAQPTPQAAPAAASAAAQAGPGSTATLAAAASGAGRHAAAMGTAHMGGMSPPIADTASAAAAQHAAGTPQMSGASSVSAPDTSSAAHGSMGAAGAGGAAAGEGGSGGSGMMGGGMGGGMRGGQGGGDYEHKSKIRLNSSTSELFGKVEQTAPPVIGED